MSLQMKIDDVMDNFHQKKGEFSCFDRRLIFHLNVRRAL